MTPLFMLDTDTVSFALRGLGRVADALLERAPSEICMSAVTLAELRYGADHRRSKKLHALIDTFAAAVAVVPFDEAAATSFGKIGADLRRAGTPIGELDTMIAAHALALDVTLVTNNTRHFRRVPHLHIENWA
ncbi:MAG: type II toxin-antitoxin system VapC family toxin [Polyangiaceae bacterium]